MIRSRHEIDPDIIFLDAKNLPDFDVNQFEGRIERPIGHRALRLILSVLFLLLFVFIFRLGNLQIMQGKVFAQKSENNTLKHTTVFSQRGMITDRNGAPLAWNEQVMGTSSSPDFAIRKYSVLPGISHLVGYLKYPAKDASGNYYNTDYVPKAGVELFYDQKLRGRHGIQLTETDVRGGVISQSIIEPPKHGDTLALSVDSRLQSLLYDTIKDGAKKGGFTGGAGLMLDLSSGELLAHVTYPEYSSETMTNGSSSEINRMLADKRKPFLDRVSTGLYSPGSIVKPFMSLAALNEKIISPDKKILSTGALTLPNPFNPSKPSIFRDWKAHGWVDMRDAISVSSDVYFYEVGGGFKDQPGLGINKIYEYMHLFGFGEPMQSPFLQSMIGTVPNPEWKIKHFKGDPWRVGDTYLTSIGQYGFLTTPIQALRAFSAIATNGTRIEPTIIHNDTSVRSLYKQIPLDSSYYQIVHEGMRDAVQKGTALALSSLPLAIGAKTGTAEIGIKKDFNNSWVVGYYPYDSPKYAFVLLMEHAPHTNLFGASPIMSQFFQKLITVAPEYTL